MDPSCHLSCSLATHGAGCAGGGDRLHILKVAGELGPRVVAARAVEHPQVLDRRVQPRPVQAVDVPKPPRPADPERGVAEHALRSVARRALAVQREQAEVLGVKAAAIVLRSLTYSGLSEETSAALRLLAGRG